MKAVHNIKLSVFIHEDESFDDIKQSFLALLPFDLEKEKLKLNHIKATGAQENKIDILELFLQRQPHIKKFIANLLENLSPNQIQLLDKQAESRLDPGLNFFIRLDKTQLLQDKFKLTDSGNCFHIRILIAAFPAKRDTALTIIHNLLSPSPN
ncbi:RNA-binding domain-containing protein [Nanoarchaeota archaeon]